MKKLTEFQLAQSLDQTNLNPFLTYDEYVLFFEESRNLNFSSVAILPIYTQLAAKILNGSHTIVDAAISYPLGCVPAILKAKEVEHAVKFGAGEIDYVVNIAAIKSGSYKKVFDEAQMIISAANGKPVKAIIEMWNLSEEEVRATCEELIAAHVTYIKSSTAYKGYKNMREGTIDDALLLKKVVHNRAKVKIAGGIRDIDQVYKLLDLGVDRIGTSSGVRILDGFRRFYQNN